jgi:hypothetical protein
MEPETLLVWRDRLTVFGLLATTVAGAYVVFFLTRKLYRRTSRIVRVAVVALGAVAVCIVLFAGMVVTVVAGPAPSDSPWARLGQERANSVLTALESFRAETGHYPESFVELTPRHLPPGPRTLGAFNNGRFGEWEYRRTGPASFELKFRFSGPGMNYCLYSSDKKNWTCSGYF